MCILVVGSSGLLGSNVVQASRERGHNVAGTFRSTEPSVDADLYRLELPDATRFRSLIERVQPTAVVNCAAVTNVDRCEESPTRARAVNATAPGELAVACDEAGVKFGHVSTDYVFDGRSDKRYTESMEPNPLQRYGETKLEGERAVRTGNARSLIVRPSFLYGIHRGSGTATGFPAWLCDQLDSDESVPLFDDQYLTPSRARTTAETILDLIDSNSSGIYHVASETCVTPYEFGNAIQSKVGEPAKRLERAQMSDVDRTATRPRNTCLDISKVESTLERTQPSLWSEIETIEHCL